MFKLFFQAGTYYLLLVGKSHFTKGIFDIFLFLSFLSMCWSMYLTVFLTILLFLHTFFFFQAEDGIRDLVRSRGLGDVYKRQIYSSYYLPTLQ